MAPFSGQGHRTRVPFPSPSPPGGALTSPLLARIWMGFRTEMRSPWAHRPPGANAVRGAGMLARCPDDAAIVVANAAGALPDMLARTRLCQR